MRSLELWAGVECTVNRLGDAYFDQVVRSGHDRRPADLDLIAGLGVSAVRYPVLWERVAPDGLEHASWRWTDERLARLRDLGIRPVVGLLHHGSGPRSTSLLDPAFPRKLAAYAAAVARRYPWIEDYTPVNEPLTTARFSALYGYWYPHHRDERSFVTALFNQVKGSVLAMSAIREVNPSARLVQTDDAGRVSCAPGLEYQAEFENERRWLTWDLLSGRVDDRHVLWRYLLHAGATATAIEWFGRHLCPPGIVGLNYYLTSDRFLDREIDQYPRSSHGGNGRETYADVEAVRATQEGCAGHQRVLEAAWQRYGLPVAFTEVHAGGGRDDQVRWVAEAWSAAHRAREQSADVRAVTLWALFGSFDWDTLLVRCNGTYEPGVFDVRTGEPRPTALAAAARALARGEPAHEICDQPGWWRRADRVTYGPPAIRHSRCAAGAADAGRPMLIAGARGTLGSALARACARRGLPAMELSRQACDVTDAAAFERALEQYRPWGVINASGHVRVDDAEREPAECLRLNAQAPAEMAARCGAAGAQFVTFSSDLVFDGTLRRPYVESDAPAPLNVYGISKVEAEARVAAAFAGALIIRTSAFFGPHDHSNFLTAALRALEEGRSITAANDVLVSPTYVPDLADVTLDLLIDREEGIWHLANRGEITWLDFAVAAAVSAGLDPSLIRGVPLGDLALAAPRPRYSVLGSIRGALMADLGQVLARYVRDRKAVRLPV